MSTYLDRFYNTLFHPLQTFSRIASPETDGEKNHYLLEGVLTVILISAMAPILHYALNGASDGSMTRLLFSIPLYTVIGILTWASIAFILGMMAYAYTGVLQLRTFLILSAYATLPWLFMCPLTLIKLSLGLSGELATIIIGLMIWLWSVLLFALALKKSYALSGDQVIIILLLPMILSFVSFAWTIGFFMNLIQLMPS